MISIIVPVYNVENCLRRCIESILYQSYQDFELILVDDGSTDDSGNICDEYALNDFRIKVFHKKNEGVSVTRNFGLAKAKGEWIAFVDSDDYLLPSALISMQKTLEKVDADLYLFDYQQNGNVCRLPFGENLSKEDFIKSVLTYKIQTSPWAKLYRRKFLENLSFNPSLSIGEDLLFNFEYAIQLSDDMKIYHDNSIVYSYEFRETSVMQSKCIKDKYDKLNTVAIPIIKAQVSDRYHSALALFEAINIFQGNWKCQKLPTIKEDKRLVDLNRQIGNLENRIMAIYICLLKKSRMLAHTYLKYRYIRYSIKSKMKSFSIL